MLGANATTTAATTAGTGRVGSFGADLAIQGSKSPRTGLKLGRREWQVSGGVRALTASDGGFVWRRRSRDEQRERKVGGDSEQKG